MLAASCGDDDPVSSGGATPTFTRQLDFGEYDTYYSVSRARDGAILVGGQADLLEIDSSGATPDTTENPQAILIKYTSDGDTLWSAMWGMTDWSESVVAIEPTDIGLLTSSQKTSMLGPGSNVLFQQVFSDGSVGWDAEVDFSQFDYAPDITATSDGNYVAVGFGISMGGYGEMGIVKLDPSGSVVWQKEILYLDTTTTATNVLELPDSTLLVAGTFESSANHDRNLYLRRMRADGDSLFAAMIPMSGLNKVHDFQVTDDGFRLLGDGSDGIRYGTFIINTDTAGVMLTAQYWFRDVPFGISDGRFTSDGGAVLCGYYNKSGYEDGGLLIKLDAAGELEWEREFDELQTTIRFYAVMDYSGGYVVVGDIKPLLEDNQDMLLIRTDSRGMVTEN